MAFIRFAGSQVVIPCVRIAALFGGYWPVVKAPVPDSAPWQREAQVTQTQDRTVDSAAAGWPGFAAWLARKRVTLTALVLIAAQVGLDSFVLNHGSFQEDDFIIGGLAAKPFSLHLLFQHYFGQLMPGVFAMAFGPVHSGGYDWGLWAGTLVLLQALAGLALLRALRTLCGDRMLLLFPLGLFLFTPMTMVDLTWWSVGIQSVPIQLALAMAVDQHVRYIRGGRITNAVYAALWVLFGLAFFEKAAAIPVLLFALTSAYLVPASWPEGMLITLRRHWIAWSIYAATIIAEIVIYLSGLHSSPVRLPPASSAVTFGWHLLLNTFVPAAFGGPWRWTPTPGEPSGWVLYAFAAAPAALAVLSWALAALMVMASLWYRRRAWPAWIILLGWLVAVDIVPIVLGRLAAYGTPLASQTGYVADAAPVLAICLAIGFLPLRGEADAYRTAPPHGPPVTAVTSALAVLFVTGSLWSAVSYRGELQPRNTRSYLATAAAALAAVPADTVIYPTAIPAQMASPLFGRLAWGQNALAPLANRVADQHFSWTNTPTGQVGSFMVFDAQGRLHQAALQGPHSFPFSRKASCVLTAGGMRLPLSGNVYPLPFLMQIGYYSARPVTLAVTFGGHRYRITLPASVLAYAYLPVQGPGNSIVFTSVTPDPKICIGTVTIGKVYPSTIGTSVPVSPLRA
jgi:hypothetical protein